MAMPRTILRSWRINMVSACPAEHHPSGSFEANDARVKPYVGRDERKQEPRQHGGIVPPENARDHRGEAEQPQVWRRHRVAPGKMPTLAVAGERPADEAAEDERVQVNAI